jgi:hypothetical protein
MRSWRVGFGLLVAGVTLAANAGCTGSGSDPAPSPSPSGLPRAADSATAPDGGVVRVAESGFSVDLDVTTRYVFGAVVENTSRNYVLSYVGVTFRFFDGEGRAREVLRVSERFADATVVPPGGRKGVGAEIVRGNFENEPAPAKVTATLGDSFSWILASVMPTLTISDPRYETDASGVTWMEFVLDSEYPATEPLPDLVFIYRDAAGVVVGGQAQERQGEPWPQGRSTQRIGLPRPKAVLKTYVPEKTEIYVNPATPYKDKNGERF